MIPFNKPYLTGKETNYIKDAVDFGRISGNGLFTKKCQEFFEGKYGFKKTFLTTSCTDALEMCAILADIKVGDEVIIPSYTFVSTALAFVRQGAKIIFADSCDQLPNIDADKLELLITKKTKAIVPVHYGGIACDMDPIMALAAKYNLLVIEDAAPAIDSYYKERPLGSIGHMAAFSFHETKNINSGEGGLLVINDERFIKRAEIVWEKGTNRAAFFRGEVDSYSWVDIGSSFLPSEIVAAYLWAQLNEMGMIQAKRKRIGELYDAGLTTWAKEHGIDLPYLPGYASYNGHSFYLVCNTSSERDRLIEYLNSHEINAVFHYQSLHKSPYYAAKHKGEDLLNSNRFSDQLVRLPFYYELTDEEVQRIINLVKEFKF